MVICTCICINFGCHCHTELIISNMGLPINQNLMGLPINQNLQNLFYMQVQLNFELSFETEVVIHNSTTEVSKSNLQFETKSILTFSMHFSWTIDTDFNVGWILLFSMLHVFIVGNKFWIRSQLCFRCEFQYSAHGLLYSGLQFQMDRSKHYGNSSNVVSCCFLTYWTICRQTNSWSVKSRTGQHADSKLLQIS